MTPRRKPDFGRGLCRELGKLYDKSGREIMLGDVLKVYHFTGARNKRFYMYKQAMRVVPLGKKGARYLWLSHLNLRDDDGYHERLDGRILGDVEIVQSVDAQFDLRPRARELAAFYVGVGG